MQLVGCLTPAGLGTFELSAFAASFAASPGSREERCVITSFRIAESMGLKGDFRQWEQLLRVGD